MKVVINSCYGGFNLSVKGIKKYCDLSGTPCFFFNRAGYLGLYRPYASLTFEEAQEEEKKGILSFPACFKVPNPQEHILHDDKKWREMSLEERKEHKESYSKIDIDDRNIPRDDPFLVRVVELLGKEASRTFANLRVVEIPDDVQWQIEEYDGKEHVVEVHRTWR